ncbi:TolC family protein [Denitromonas iodatirespirans]|uniref:TolC family protein n=1 Tax=Denitromonas iodatirespirans TaxID=2795389 RepID=A0A944DE94_DENI1|nr:TolC family protein [Denitromonas iodatirespirans]MBT0963456.1 TolC family protein [Denitromonas iodatirespirans]
MPLRFRHKAPIVVFAAAALTGCAINPQPLQIDELRAITRADWQKAQANVPPLTAPLSLSEAIARALKFNLEHRAHQLEEAHAAGLLEAGRFDMLPKLVAGVGYYTRDKDLVRDSINATTRQPNLSNSISTEKDHTVADLSLTWSLLDFGASYYTAQQNADRLLVAGERRRRSMHNLIQNVRAAFWRAASAQKLEAAVRENIALAESALADARKVTDERIKAPAEMLRYRRALIENLRTLEAVQQELGLARVELAALTNLPPGTRYQLVEPAADELEPQPLALKLDAMEEIALTRNADLRESAYNVRIAAADTRKSLLQLFPGISFNYSVNHDDDRFLVNNSWNEAGLRVNFNLFNLLSAPARLEAAEGNERVYEARRMALQMVVVSLVHLSAQQYDNALRQYQRSDELATVDNDLLKLSRRAAEVQKESQLSLVAARTNALLSELRRYQALAAVHASASRVQATLGLEPAIGSLDDMSLPDLSKAIDDALRTWQKDPLAAAAMESAVAQPVRLAERQ